MKLMHRSLKALPLIGLSMILGRFTVHAQQGPSMEWGVVDTADLRMKTYAPDTSAPAVVLFDVGRLEFNDNGGFTLRRHRRVKILSKEGFDWATYSVSAYTKNHEEKLQTSKGSPTLSPLTDRFRRRR